MKRTLKLFMTLIAFATACFGASESKALIIPLSPGGEQKVSEKIRQRISVLEEEGAFLALASWRQIPELPAWVFVEKKREIAFVFARPMASDAYRYAVILGRKKELIIVRAGGIAGTYEIFAKPETPKSEGSVSP
jgi:hypothetical protein